MIVLDSMPAQITTHLCTLDPAYTSPCDGVGCLVFGFRLLKGERPHMSGLVLERAIKIMHWVVTNILAPKDPSPSAASRVTFDPAVREL